MKYICVLAFACLAVVVVAAYPRNHNVTWGVPGYYDTLIFKQQFRKTSKMLQIVSEDVVFPPRGVINRRNITAIRAIDLYKNSNGGYAQLYAGGIGKNFTTIHLKSQRGHGYNFTIEIYVR